MSKISANSQIFADQCVLNGFTPPHPGDVQRAINMADFAKTLSPNALVAHFSDNSAEDTTKNANNEIPKLTSNDIDIIIGIANKTKESSLENLSQEIQQSLPHITINNIENIIQVLVSKGEIKELPTSSSNNQ